MSRTSGSLPSPGRRRSSGWLVPVVILGIGGALFLVVLVGFLVLSMSRSGDGLELFGEKVAIVEISGPIFSAEEWLELLEDCTDNDGIAAVVLYINSPGGAIAPTQEIYDAVRKITTDEKKPVIAYLGSVAASGGYYVACAADQVIAMPGSLTGSIGVYMQMANLSDLLQKVGVEFPVIKKGAFKGAGDSSRDMHEHERAMFQSVVDDYYDQFLDAVVESRKRNRTSLARGWNESLPGGLVTAGTNVASLGGVFYPSGAWNSTFSPGFSGVAVSQIVDVTTDSDDAETVVNATSETESGESAADEEVAPATEENVVSEPDEDQLAKLFAKNLTDEEIHARVALLAEGRIYTGRQARNVGLVDQIGTLEDAINLAGEMAGLGEEPKTTKKKKKKSRGFFASLKAETGLFEGSRFLYFCPLGY